MATEANLRYTAGSSDKVYQARIEEKPDGCIVTFAYGRYGSALRPGTKTPAPVTKEKALNIFNKLVTEKLSEGYRPVDAAVTDFVGSDKLKQASGILPQLLCPIDEDRLEGLFQNPAWIMQEKIDGERRLIQATHAGIIGINKKGEVVPLPQEVAKAVAALGVPCVLDGELIGTTFYAFDLLDLDGADLRARGYWNRYVTLVGFLQPNRNPSIRLVPAVRGDNDKRVHFANIKGSRGEGVVFKLADKPYTVGRTSDQVKYKFTATATVQVTKVNAKNSIAVSVRDNGKLRSMGNVTIPANHTMPQSGDLVEVRYLYAYPNGSLFQAVYLGPRNDQADCDDYSSLKFKATPDDGDDA